MTSARNRIVTTGTPIAIHEKKEIRTPAIFSSMPMPIRFGGVPTGVPMPPIDGPNDVISIMASAKRRTSAGCVVAVRIRCATIDSPMGNIIAVVAVLLIHIEINVQTAP